MIRVETADTESDMLIRISPKRGSIILEEKQDNGIIAYKEISILEFYYILNRCYQNEHMVNSGILPPHCLRIMTDGKDRRYLLWNPELRANLIYNDIEYPDFPIPRLVFDVRVLETGKVADCAIGVVADESPTLDTVMYHYPFSNVHNNGSVCTGNNNLPKYRNPLSLKHFPRYLLGLPDNDDMFNCKKNKLGLSHKQLMELLKDKDPAYYYEQILIPNGKTLREFIDRR